MSRLETNLAILEKLKAYFIANPDERFWQGLRNCAGFNFIYVSGSKPPKTDWVDTFYWKGLHGKAKPPPSHR